MTQDSVPPEGTSRRAALAGSGALASTSEIPAPSPLPGKSITVAGGKITLA